MEQKISGRLGLADVSYYTEWVNNNTLLNSTESYIQYPMKVKMKKNIKKIYIYIYVYIYICITESLCCTTKQFSYTYKYIYMYIWASPIAQLVKNSPAMQEIWVQSLGFEDPLEKEKTTSSIILAQTIPWTVQSMGSQRVGQD